MERIPAKGESADQAYSLVERLQFKLVATLESVAEQQGYAGKFAKVEWFRDEGRHGGGVRFVAPEGGLFNRASVNVSQVQYDDLPEKKLASANAISSIVHPVHPHAPSIHLHISWTEMKSGDGYWRIMADLNPAIPYADDTAQFRDELQKAAGDHFEEGTAQGERYFFIPALKRHRGVSHFYLEGFHTAQTAADYALAESFGEAMIGAYGQILSNRLQHAPAMTQEDRDAQIAYHTLYLFQVLTLDRGTTSGLLVHDQNDVGIMGSLPSHIDRDLLASWESEVPKPQDQLVKGLVGVFPKEKVCLVDESTKIQLAKVVRQHYQNHPEALKLQASGDSVPPTVNNHS